MRTYKYKGYSFRATDTFTNGSRTVFGKIYHDKFLVPLYEIDGLKDRGTRPLLTSIKEVKEYIEAKN